jgi:hypothetical protein
MIDLKLVVEILASDDWYVNDEDIKRAKGKYKVGYNLKGIINNIKRA